MNVGKEKAFTSNKTITQKKKPMTLSFLNKYIYEQLSTALGPEYNRYHYRVVTSVTEKKRLEAQNLIM